MIVLDLSTPLDSLSEEYIQSDVPKFSIEYCFPVTRTDGLSLDEHAPR
jgi:hypothetical protein